MLFLVFVGTCRHASKICMLKIIFLNLKRKVSVDDMRVFIGIRGEGLER